MIPLIASLIVVEALLDGGAPPAVRSVAAILVWWTILGAAAFSLVPRDAVPRAAVVCGALLGAFALFTALSIAWAPSAERAFAEADRILLYAGLFLIPVLMARRGEAGAWADAMALAVAVVATLALAQRLFPSLLPEGDVAEQLPNAATRLSYPLGYWNGLAMFVALGVPLLLRTALAAPALLWRAAAIAPIPVIAGTIYLTSSRGGVAVAVVGAVAFAIAVNRVQALVALAVAAVGSAAAVAILAAREPLVDGPFDSSAATDAGIEAALLIAAVCLAGGVVYALLSREPWLRMAIPRTVWTVAALVAVAGAIVADPAERFREFKAAPGAREAPGSVDVGAHLASGVGSGRWQFWSAATDQWRDHPLAGDGAGSFEPYWAQHGTLDWFVRNAHSLWVETLGELGVIGLLLIAAAFAVGIGAGIGRLRGQPAEERLTVAGLLALVVAFCAGAALDWIWQLPVVALLGLVTLGLLTGPATLRATRAPPAAQTVAGFGARVALVLLAWGVICAQALPFLASEEVSASQRAAARGDLGEALDRARSAEAIQPWASSTHLQLALVHEANGDVPAGREEIAEAIDRDRTDWRLWVVGARLAVKDGDIPAARRALARARDLNPRSRLLGTALNSR